MRKSTKGKTVRMLLLAALLLVCVAGKPVCAASTLPTTGSITIQLTTELGTSKEGVGFNLYKVGNWNAARENWLLDGRLSGTGIVLDNLSTASDWDSAAQTLSGQLATANIGSSSVITTDADGKLTAKNLVLGMYLVIQEGTNNYGTVSPFLVSLPVKDGDNYKVDITASPKAAAFPAQTPESPSPATPSPAAPSPAAPSPAAPTPAAPASGAEEPDTSQNQSSPTSEPAAGPTTQPTARPTTQPTARPTTQPTAGPTTQPTVEPTTQPTEKPAASASSEEEAKPEETSAPEETKPGEAAATGGAQPTDAAAESEEEEEQTGIPVVPIAVASTVVAAGAAAAGGVVFLKKHR